MGQILADQGHKMMSTKPDWLIEKEITLPDGTIALVSYDTEGDMLEIFFAEGTATGTVELADGVLLRLDVEHTRPLSLAVLSVTPLLHKQAYGPPLLELDGVDSLPDDLRQIVVQIITSAPVNTVLKVYSYIPRPQAKVMPVASLDQAIMVPA
jgi:hypothetical protein